MKEGRKPEYPEKTPDDELQKFSISYLVVFFAQSTGVTETEWTRQKETDKTPVKTVPHSPSIPTEVGEASK